MMFLASNGYRCIAHDRRGHGRSSQPWSGNEMDTYPRRYGGLQRALRPQNDGIKHLLRSELICAGTRRLSSLGCLLGGPGS